jgi:hypothetical protein
MAMAVHRGAHTAGELYGRALVVIAAEQYASRLVVPTSQRSHPTGWGSHKDRARKPLTKLAGPHLPASLKQLEKAIAKTHAQHDQALSAGPEQPERPPSESEPDERDTDSDDATAELEAGLAPRRIAAPVRSAAERCSPPDRRPASLTQRPAQ